MVCKSRIKQSITNTVHYPTVVRLDSAVREKLEQSKEFLNNLRYADLIIINGESAADSLSLAEEFNKRKGSNFEFVFEFCLCL